MESTEYILVYWVLILLVASQYACLRSTLYKKGVIAFLILMLKVIHIKTAIHIENNETIEYSNISTFANGGRIAKNKKVWKSIYD